MGWADRTQVASASATCVQDQKPPAAAEDGSTSVAPAESTARMSATMRSGPGTQTRHRSSLRSRSARAKAVAALASSA